VNQLEQGWGLAQEVGQGDGGHLALEGWLALAPLPGAADEGHLTSYLRAAVSD